MQNEDITAGDRLVMMDLRNGKKTRVVAVHVPESGKILVAVDGNREIRYEVGAGFLSKDVSAVREP
jgi:hypothetical protein